MPPSHAGTYADSDVYDLAMAPAIRRRIESSRHRGDADDGVASRYPFARPTGRPVSLEVVQGLLRLGDIVTVLSAGTLVVALTSGAVAPRLWQAIVAGTGLLFLLQMGLQHGYSPSALISTRRSGLPRQVAAAWLVAALLGGLLCMAVGIVEPSRSGWLLLWSLLVLLGLLGSRGLVLRLAAGWQRQGKLARNIAVVGVNGAARRLLARLDRCNAQDVRIAGIYAEAESPQPRYLLGHALRGTIEDLVAEARRRRIDAVVLCPTPGAGRREALALARLRQIAVDIHVYDEGGRRYHAATASDGMLAGLPLVTVARLPLRGWAAVAKGIEDRLIAAAILVLIAPLLAIIAILIKLDSPGPVLFSQNRYGWNNEPIRILKFRTLHHHANDKAAGTLVTRNDSRVTRLGGLLRRTSLDELPQFINVLRGEMSIVGPRPHAAAAKAGGLLYDEAVEYYHARHRVKPGITGWAQVNGWRGETRTVEQIKARVDHDLYYIDHWSLAFDLRIIVKTVLCGFVGRQAY